VPRRRDIALKKGEFLTAQVSAPPPAKKTAGQIEKETNSSPQSSQGTLRKKI